MKSLDALSQIAVLTYNQLEDLGLKKINSYYNAAVVLQGMEKYYHQALKECYYQIMEYLMRKEYLISWQ